MEYKLSTVPPPVYERARELWGVDFDKGVVFTFGDTIHCKWPIPPDVLAHELVHVKQQTEQSKDYWWFKYFTDAEFRLEQELEAYRAQYQWIVKHVKDRNIRAKYLTHYAQCLSGEMYGKMLLQTDAIKLIRNA